MLALIAFVFFCLVLASGPALGGYAFRKALESADPHER